MPDAAPTCTMYACARPAVAAWRFPDGERRAYCRRHDREIARRAARGWWSPPARRIPTDAAPDVEGDA